MRLINPKLDSHHTQISVYGEVQSTFFGGDWTYSRCRIGGGGGGRFQIRVQLANYLGCKLLYNTATDCMAIVRNADAKIYAYNIFESSFHQVIQGICQSAHF